jgi:hypothetical protein
MQHNDELFQSALAALAHGLGLAGLAFDKENFCNLEVEGTSGVSIRKDEARSCLVLAGAVAPAVSEKALAVLAEDLLALALGPMHGDIPALGYDDEAEMLIAYQIIPLWREYLQSEDLAALFSTFVDFLLNAGRLLDAAESNLAQVKASADEAGLLV